MNRSKLYSLMMSLCFTTSISSQFISVGKNLSLAGVGVAGPEKIEARLNDYIRSMKASDFQGIAPTNGTIPRPAPIAIVDPSATNSSNPMEKLAAKIMEIGKAAEIPSFYSKLMGLTPTEEALPAKFKSYVITADNTKHAIFVTDKPSGISLMLIIKGAEHDDIFLTNPSGKLVKAVRKPAKQQGGEEIPLKDAEAAFEKEKAFYLTIYGF